MEILDIQEILNSIPHRYPFLLVDRVINIDHGKSLDAIKNVSINEPFFNGHFPMKAIMPGVLIVEALAQAAAILVCKSTGWTATETLFYLGSIDDARFKKMVVPGDQLHLRVDVLKHRAQVWKFRGTASVDGQIACTAEMTSAEGKIKS